SIRCALSSDDCCHNSSANSYQPNPRSRRSASNAAKNAAKSKSGRAATRASYHISTKDLYYDQRRSWRLNGGQDEEQETQEAPLVCHVVREQLAGSIRRDSWLADDCYPEAGGGEGVSHCMQRSGPETKQCGLTVHGPFIDVVVGLEIVGLTTLLALRQ